MFAKKIFLKIEFERIIKKNCLKLNLYIFVVIIIKQKEDDEDDNQPLDENL